MVLEKPEQVEEKLTEIINSVIGNQGLIHFLEGCEDWKSRWEILEKQVINHLNDYGLGRTDWGLDTMCIGYLRDRFFYEMQQKTEMDFGFCSYFIPAYKERTIYFLGGQKEDPEKNWDKCAFDSKEVSTTCNGTQRDICLFLHPEKKN